MTTRSSHTPARLLAALVALTLGAACSNNPAAPPADAAPDAAPTPAPAVVTTKEGDVRGNVTATLRTFKGIPYAAPPVGALRWKAPAAALTRSAVLDASGGFANHCPQAGGTFGIGSMTEDCLFLNIYTPPVVGTYPVMVWIHGGAFLTGASDSYDPTTMIAENVIVVTINYRLGTLGFLTHPSLDTEQGGHSGNYGLLDQQAALKWVQGNIAAFGGDKTNVTIFGESAGGLSVLSQLVSPGAAGLFAKAIVESGSYANATTPVDRQLAQQAAQQAAIVPSLTTSAACAATCTTTELRGLTVAQVLTSEATLSNLEPTVDGTVLPKTVAAALAAGEFTKVPTIQGTNHDEWRLFVAIGDLPPNMKATPDNYMDKLTQTFGAAAASVLAPLYPLTSYGNDANIALSTAGTDQIFACAGRAAAGQLTAGSTTTYAYEFADPAPPLSAGLQQLFGFAGFPAASYHSAEIQFVFGNAGTMTADEKALSGTMVKYWTSFAKTGDPNYTGGVVWPKYTIANDSYLKLVPGAGLTAVTTGFKTDHKCP